MSGVDNRIVTMKFDNASFESGARTTLSTLQKLKEGMNFGTIGATTTRALGGIQSILSRFGVKNPFASATAGASELNRTTQAVGAQGITSIEGGITGLSTKWAAMATVAVTALSNIVTSAQQAGTQMVKSLTVDPVKGGLDEYETNLNSIQTILANTKVAGTGLPEVNAALEELNNYSDKTIYNFSEMAKNIGTFTAAGVDLDTSVQSIKGIANLAALSGSNSQQASTAMYQLSQEIAAGRVSLMGWNSVVNAGMGGSTFQRALVTTAQNMGTLNGKTVEFQGKMKNATIDGMSFRDSIMAKPGEQSWLSKEVLTGTLAQFTGDMTDAELAAEGFTEAQIKDIQQMAKTAEDAATKVKTLSGVFDTAKEVVGSGWAKTWQLVFGDFKEARKFFTDFSIGFNDILGGIADRRNEVLSQWNLRGGRDMAIEGLKTAWESLLTIFRPIKRAFRDIFPATTARDLMDITRNFMEFAENLRISKDTAKGLRSTFSGVFAIFSIVGQVIGAIAGAIGDIFGAIGEGSGGFLDFTGGLGDMIVRFDQFLEKSGVLKEFFGSIAGFISVPIRLLSGFAEVLASMFGSFDVGGAGRASGAMEQFGGAAEKMASGADRILSMFQGLGEVIGGVADMIVDGLGRIGYLISEAITPESFSASLDVINTALLGGIVIMLKKFFNGGINVDVGGGFFSTIKETLGAATETLQNMQASLKADILLKIAGALAILAGALFLLSTIDSRDLTKALVAMGIGFVAMQVGLVSLNTAIGVIGAAKLPLIAGAMVLLATSLLILAGALKIMGDMDLYEIARGLVGIGGVLVVIQKAMKPMATNAGGMIRAAAAILILGVALNIIAVAMKIFASFSWEEMAKGLVGVLGSLTGIATAMKLMPKDILIQAAAILILSVALNALAVSMKIFATMDWEEIGKGLVGIAGALVAIAGAMHLMPKNMVLQAAGLVLVAIALVGIAGAMKIMGGMSWEKIAKGLVAIGGAILILAIGLNAMGPTAIAGAAALVIAAAALAVLTPILVTLGSLKWETIIKALSTLAGVFVILGLAALILAPLLPVIAGLAASMVLIGAGLALAGVGALAFATAFGVIVAAGMAGVQILAAAIGTFIAAIPAFFVALGEAFGKFALEISKHGPAFTAAISTILNSILNSIIKNTPKIRRAFTIMLDNFLRVIRESAPKIFQAGFDLIIGFLEAISRNIDRISDLAGDIIVKFLNGIGRNIGRIIDAGFKLIIKFMEGMAKAIRENDDKMGEAGADLALALVEGTVNGLKAFGGRIKDAALDAAREAWEEVKDFFKIGSPSKLFRDEVGKRLPEGMALGIRDGSPLVVKEIGEMGKTTVDTLGSVMKGVEDAFALDPNLNPTVTPVLDLTALTQEANKMSDILATAPIMAGVSYQTAADISAMTQASSEPGDGPDDPGSGEGGRGDVSLTLELHSPKPIDSVESYRAGKTLISLAKEALDS